MRTYGKNKIIDGKDDISVQSLLVIANLRKGDKFKVNGVEWTVTIQTDKTLRLKSVNKTLSFKVKFFDDFGVWICNSGKGYDPADNFIRDIEGELVLDSINKNNPFHELSDCGEILLRDPIFEKNRLEHFWDSTKNVFHDVVESKLVRELKESFTLPQVKSEIKRYANGFKGEAKETKEAFIILGKYMKKEEITDDEKKLFKEQMVDLLKGVGVVVPIQLIPLPFVSTFLLIVMEKTLKSMGINILPSSFYETESELKK